MPGSLRTATLALAVALAACSSSAPPPRTCADETDCPADARCLGGACVANAAPLPVIALPAAALETNVLLTFDGSGSTDPDEGDAVASWAWAFRAVAAPCAAPDVASAAPQANVRFACAGRYAADLTVTDQLARSATRTVEFDVAALAPPGLVTAGADVSLDHACTALPTRCAPSGEVTLSASAPSVGSPDLSFRWTVEPPSGRPLDANRRVTFVPDADAAAPSVLIETDGQAISGDWIFEVEARDGAGIVGTAVTRVSVGNRDPVVERTIPLPAHAFDGARFTASGEIPFTMTDPDGDALVGPVLSWHHAGDGDATFGGQLLEGPTRLAFAIEVPYAAPEDALHLIGGEGLQRSVTFEVTDVNGATTTDVWPIDVGNRPPVLVSAPAPFSVEHSYDATAGAYVAAVGLSTWSDPDGDPLRQAAGAGTGDPACPSFTIEGGAGARRATGDCSLRFEGTPAVANFAGTHSVTQAVQDPWAGADQPSTVTFTILNRPPAIASVAKVLAAGSCTKRSVCCDLSGVECVGWYHSADAMTFTLPSRWSDPDGDPLDVRAGAVEFVRPVQPLVCTPAECGLVLELDALTDVCHRDLARLTTSVSDGLASASGPLDVERTCDPLP